MREFTVEDAIAWREGVKNDDGTPYPVHNFQVIDPLIAEVKRLRKVEQAAKTLDSKAEETRFDDQNAMVAPQEYFEELAEALYPDLPEAG